jgi:putative transposase
VFILHARLVFITRYRVSAARHLDCTEQNMRDVHADSGTGLAKFNGEPRARAPAGKRPPAVAISRLARSLNGVSSRRLRQEFPDLRQYYWRARRLWSGSYFANPIITGSITDPATWDPVQRTWNRAD